MSMKDLKSKYFYLKKLFEEEYKKVQEKFDGKYDLAAIWYIEPVQYRSKDVNERFKKYH